MAQRTSLREVEVRQCLVDDHHRGGLVRVAALQQPPFDRAHAESLQVISAGDAEQRVPRIAWHAFASFDAVTLRVALAAERRIGRVSDASARASLGTR